jgi:serine/threonine-protein kinase
VDPAESDPLLPARATVPLDPQATRALDPQATQALPPSLKPSGPRFPVEGWDRFQPLAFLGQGGMGRVFKARDPRLDRVVALKFIRGEDPELLRRFEAEAKSQALIEHPHVCKVYEVGVEQDEHYIAMQFIPGVDLSRARREMNLQEKVRVMRDVAEAIHAAHRQGIIHRDLKPANIMMERTEEGRWWPYVMDFGLARDVAGSGLTVSGVAMGTPAYMPPEQAQGRIQDIDRRSDVYSLGVTLYELLAEVLPFEADSMTGILMKVIQDEPIPLRKRLPSIPADLETIVQKCLEKEPHRRYDSAKALADDLARFLDGEPISARPASLAYRVSKRLRKNKTLTAAVLISAFLGLGFMAYGLRATVLARRQAQLANHFALEVKAIEEVMQVAHMRPLHDVRAEETKVRTRMASIQREMQSLGALAEGPGNLALGLGHRALGESAEALKALQRAWDEDYRPPQVALALGEALAAEYERSFRAAQQLPKEDREAQTAQLRKTLLEPAQALIRTQLGAQQEGRSYLEALLAHLQGRDEDAIAKAQAAFQESPGSFDAKRLEADAHLALALRKRDSGDFEGSRLDLDAAGVALKEAQDLGRSDGALWRDEADRRLDLGALSAERSPLPQVEEEYHQAAEACQQSLRIDPGDVAAMHQATIAWHDLATFQLDHGVDSRPALETARTWAERAIALRPQDGELFFWLGRVNYALARVLDHGGQEAAGAYDKAIEAYTQAEALGREASERAALTLLFKSFYQRRLGQDPSGSLADAQRLVRQARARKEDRFSLNTMGLVLNASAEWAMAQGKDPRVQLAEARESFQKGFDRYHAFASLRNLADSLVLQARYERIQGRDPQEILQQALAVIHQAIGLGPKYFLSHLTEGTIQFLLAQRALDRKETPTLTAGRTALETAIRLNPEDPEAYLRLARLELLGDPQPENFRQAQGRLEQVLKLAPGLAEVHLEYARLYLKQGGATAVIQGLRSADRALALHPGLGEALAIKGALLLLQARQERNPALRIAGIRSLEAGLRADATLKPDYGSLLNAAATSGP